MPEVIFNGPNGRLEGCYHQSKRPNAPLALLLHPHPQYGGTMNNEVVFNLYQNFARRGCSSLRFNFRGVGRSQGQFDNGQGELSDAASALDFGAQSKEGFMKPKVRPPRALRAANMAKCRRWPAPSKSAGSG